MRSFSLFAALLCCVTAAFDGVRSVSMSADSGKKTLRLLQNYFENITYASAVSDGSLQGHKNVKAVYTESLSEVAETRLADAHFLTSFQALLQQLQRMVPLINTIDDLLQRADEIPSADRVRDRIARFRGNKSSESTQRFIGEMRPVLLSLREKSHFLEELEEFYNAGDDSMQLIVLRRYAPDMFSRENILFGGIINRVTTLLTSDELRRISRMRISLALRQLLDSCLPIDEYNAPSAMQDFGSSKALGVLKMLEKFTQLPAFNETIKLLDGVDLFTHRSIVSDNGNRTVEFFAKCELDNKTDVTVCVDSAEFNKQIIEIAKTEQQDSVLWKFGIARRTENAFKRYRLYTSTMILLCIDIEGKAQSPVKPDTRRDSRRSISLRRTAIKLSAVNAMVKDPPASQGSELTPPLPPSIVREVASSTRQRASHRRRTPSLTSIGESSGGTAGSVSDSPSQVLQTESASLKRSNARHSRRPTHP